MKSTICIAVLGLAWGAAMFSSPAPAQAPAPLELTLRAPTSVHTDAIAEFQVILANRNPNRTVALRGGPGFSDAGGLVLVFVDDAGHRHVAPPAYSEVTLEQARDGSRALLLQPQHALSLHRRGRMSELAPGPGRYRVHVEYSSPTPLPAVASASSHVENATAVSPSFEIEVRQ
jgi:hypothetical protein